MEYSLTFGEKLADLRVSRELQQKDLAAILGVERSTIASYESNKSKPPFEKLLKLAEYFNVSSDYLLGLTSYNTVAVCDGSDDIFTTVGDFSYKVGDVMQKILLLDDSKRKILIRFSDMLRDCEMHDVNKIIKAILTILDM